MHLIPGNVCLFGAPGLDSHRHRTADGQSALPSVARITNFPSMRALSVGFGGPCQPTLAVDQLKSSILHDVSSSMLAARIAQSYFARVSVPLAAHFCTAMSAASTNASLGMSCRDRLLSTTARHSAVPRPASPGEELPLGEQAVHESAAIAAIERIRRIEFSPGMVARPGSCRCPERISLAAA